MNENYNDCHHINKKQKTLRNVFIYKKADTFQKARQFPLRFYIKTSRTAKCHAFCI